MKHKHDCGPVRGDETSVRCSAFGKEKPRSECNGCCCEYEPDMMAKERESLERIRSTFAAMGPNKWKVNVHGLLNEVLVNDKTEVFVSPFRILLSILKEVAERSLELKDEKLLELMLRLALIEPAEEKK